MDLAVVDDDDGCFFVFCYCFSISLRFNIKGHDCIVCDRCSRCRFAHEIVAGTSTDIPSQHHGGRGLKHLG